MKQSLDHVINLDILFSNLCILLFYDLILVFQFLRLFCCKSSQHQ